LNAKPIQSDVSAHISGKGFAHAQSQDQPEKKTTCSQIADGEKENRPTRGAHQN
jgi:hypothetical protein